MKVEATEIVKFLDKVKALVEDISYTMRCGDDGFEDVVNDQIKGVVKVIDVFKLEQLTPVTPIEPAEKRYGKIYDALSEKEDRSQAEIQSLYQSQLYFALKRIIKTVDLSEVPNDQLSNHIEAAIPDNSIYKKLIYSNDFYYCSMRVLTELVDEIVEHRKKAPQQKLF